MFVFHASSPLPGLFVQPPSQQLELQYWLRHDQRYLAEQDMRRGTKYTPREVRLLSIGKGQGLRPSGAIRSRQEIPTTLHHACTAVKKTTSNYFPAFIYVFTQHSSDSCRRSTELCLSSSGYGKGLGLWAVKCDGKKVPEHVRNTSYQTCLFVSRFTDIKQKKTLVSSLCCCCYRVECGHRVRGTWYFLRSDMVQHYSYYTIPYFGHLVG